MPLPAPDLRCAGRTKPHSLTPPSRTPLRPAAAYVSSGEFSSPSTSPSRASADGYAASGTIIGIQDGTLAKIPLLLTPETSPRRKEPGSRAHARALRRARDGCAMPPRRAAPTRGLAARAASIDLTSRATPCTQRLDTADALNLAPVAGLAGRAFPGGGGSGQGGLFACCQSGILLEIVIAVRVRRCGRGRLCLEPLWCCPSCMCNAPWWRRQAAMTLGRQCAAFSVSECSDRRPHMHVEYAVMRPLMSVHRIGARGGASRKQCMRPRYKVPGREV